MSVPNRRLKRFNLSFRSTDPYEMLVLQALTRLPYGNGKVIVLRMMKLLFPECSTPEELADAINDAIDNVTSHRLVDSVKTHYPDGSSYAPVASPIQRRTKPQIMATQQRSLWKPADPLVG